jgi:hypothetical protein
MQFNRSELDKFIGKESGVTKALDQVSKSDIRHWCEIIGDADPGYNEKIKLGEKTVPHSMMMVWAMPPLWVPEPKEPTEPHELALKALDNAGYDLTIGMKLSGVPLKLINIGDRLNYTVKLESISSSEEETGIGKGYLVNLLYTFTSQKGEVVARNNYTVLKASALKMTN